MMNSEMLSRHIQIMARAEADGNYASLRSVFGVMTLEEIRQVQNVVTALKEEIDEYERKASR